MTVIDLDAAVRTAVAKHSKIDPESITVDTSFEALGMDDDETAVAVIESVEEVLDVRFPDDFLDGLRTYGELRSAVRIAVGG